MKIVVPAVAAVVATSAIAVAAIPGAGGQINGCYSTAALTKGNVRIVDEGTSCRPNEAAISWNQKGQKGDAGGAGPAGPAGPAGAKGDAGVAGAPGATGAPGTPGAKGETGPAGTDGKNGIDGKDGAKGDTGAAGPKGDTGAAGPAGPQGPAGPAGAGGGGGALEALTLGGAALSGGTADAFLEIPGVEGSSKVRGHEGAIELESFRFALHNAVTIGSTSGGAGAGKVTFGGVHITKFADGASLDLMKSVTSGSHWEDAKIIFRTRGANPVDYLTFTFKFVVVSDWEQGGKAEPVLLENVDLQVGAFNAEVKTLRPDGSVAGSETYGWDRMRNSEF